MEVIKNYLLPPFLVLLLVCSVFLLLTPGTTGPFLLDDPIHFQKLSGKDGQVDTVLEVYELMGSGSGASGRPLSFLSLLIDDNAWPAPPYEFKLTNLLIHVLNSLLVYWLVFKLTFNIRKDTLAKAMLLSGAVAFLWAVAPIQVSSVFMTIQRMTLLSSTMVLCALIFLISAWEPNSQKLTRRWLYIVLAVFFGLLGILFKESAIALAFFGPSIGFLVKFYKKEQPALYAVSIITGGFVIFGASAYYFLNMEWMADLYAKRDFNMAERVMTEGRILIEYIQQIFLPVMSETGAFHDSYPVSRGILEPISTLVSWVFIIAALTLSFLLRQKIPLIFFGLAWFFFGHILESTILPLELYFEHRNYLPSLGLWIAAIFTISDLLRSSLSYFLFGAYAILVGFLTFSSSSIWGSHGDLVHVWLSENPGSVRARIAAVKYELNHGRIDSAREVFDEGLGYLGNDAGYRLYGLIVDRCNSVSDSFTSYKIENLIDVIPNARFEHASLEGLNWLVKKVGGSSCDMSLAELEGIVRAYLSSERFSGIAGAKVSLNNNLSKLSVKQGDLNEAVTLLEENFSITGDVGYLHNIAYLLASAGLFKDAREMLSKSEAHIATEFNPIKRKQYQIELNEVKSIVSLFEKKPENN